MSDSEIANSASEISLLFVRLPAAERVRWSAIRSARSAAETLDCQRPSGAPVASGHERSSIGTAGSSSDLPDCTASRISCTRAASVRLR